MVGRACRAVQDAAARRPCLPRFSGQGRQFHFLGVPNDREAGAYANLFADQNLVQIVHAPNGLTIERHNEIALAQSSSFGGTVLLD